MIYKHYCDVSGIRGMSVIRDRSRIRSRGRIHGRGRIRGMSGTHAPRRLDIDATVCRVNHTICLQFLHDNEQMQRILNKIADGLPAPTYIPILNKHVGEGTENNKDNINAAATMLAHAVQILLFSPKNYDSTAPPQFRSGPLPAKRYPTPNDPGHFESEEAPIKYARWFSLEDFNRALVLLNLCIHRRRTGSSQSKNKLGVLNHTTPARAGQRLEWLGYHDRSSEVTFVDPFGRSRTNAISSAVSEGIRTNGNLAEHGQAATRLGHGETTYPLDQGNNDEAFQYYNPDLAKRLRDDEESCAMAQRSPQTNMEYWTALFQSLDLNDARETIENRLEESSDAPSDLDIDESLPNLRSILGSTFPLSHIPAISNNAFQFINKEASSQHGNTRPSDVSAWCKARNTSFEELVNTVELKEYLALSMENTVIKSIIGRNSNAEGEDEQATLDMSKAIKMDFIMDRIKNDFTEEANQPIDAWCQELGLNRWPHNYFCDNTAPFTNTQFACKYNSLKGQTRSLTVT